MHSLMPYTCTCIFGNKYCICLYKCNSQCRQYPLLQCCRMLLHRHLLSGVLNNNLRSCQLHFLLDLPLLVSLLCHLIRCIHTTSHTFNRQCGQVEMAEAPRKQHCIAMAQLLLHLLLLTMTGQSSIEPLIPVSRTTAVSCRSFVEFMHSLSLMISVAMCWSLPEIGMAPGLSSRNWSESMPMRNK